LKPAHFRRRIPSLSEVASGPAFVLVPLENRKCTAIPLQEHRENTVKHRNITGANTIFHGDFTVKTWFFTVISRLHIQ